MSATLPRRQHADMVRSHDVDPAVALDAIQHFTSGVVTAADTAVTPSQAASLGAVDDDGSGLVFGNVPAVAPKDKGAVDASQLRDNDDAGDSDGEGEAWLMTPGACAVCHVLAVAFVCCAVDAIVCLTACACGLVQGLRQQQVNHCGAAAR